MFWKKFKNTSYINKAEKIKNKIIKKDVKNFKKICIKEFKTNINKGLSTTTVDFFRKTTYKFEKEISEIVLRELREEYKNIEFSFSYSHFKNSYKGIRMVAIQ